ncbi:phosphatidylglycerophosphatase A [Halomonas eurihalina]|uniref:Phosphatidylglycerophosphatase A n=1 Tax=Halomonas eurihalina TaxID=42566 RepID=A0A5D9D7V9_HALER|nr:phosphatidylglycerophosphatase A [Halomonas eurihalina]MDR5860726.1 phosphatidylglycerophosphatase A [Halomonas eurihalina]TZG40054.1 phosphatidylglycerophosphatase A [Halomonas eurihalina]
MIEGTMLLLATGLGLGWLPWAPGTFGSLLGIPLAWWLLGRPLPLQFITLVLLLAIGVPLCHWASISLGGGDASAIVADEILAFPIVLLGLAGARRPWMIGAAFALYRLFDITKLPPIGHIEAIGGGLGIMLDDVVAALYAWLVLAVAIALWRRHARNDHAGSM